MGPSTLKFYERVRKSSGYRPTLDFLEHAQHFLISPEIAKATADICEETLRPLGDVAGEYTLTDLTVDWHLPADTVVFEINEAVYLVAETPDDQVAIEQVGLPGAIATPLRGALDHQRAVGTPAELEVHLVRVAIFLESLCALLMQPRLVEIGQPSDKDRERARWKLGASRVPAAWHQVTWTIGKPTKAKSDASEPGYRMPLHYTRAHYRRAEEHHARSRQLAGQDGWWTLVSGHWRGHPDFGIKLHHYTPQLTEADRGFRAPARDAPEPRIATGGAIAAALEQA